MAAADTAGDAVTPADRFRRAFEQASEGDEVQYADDQYDWSNPMRIVEAPPAITWEAATGADWFVRVLTLKGRNGGHYKAIYADIGTGPARTKSSRVDPGSSGNRTERGTIQQFTLVENTSESDETDDERAEVDLPDDVTRSDIEAAIDEHEEVRDGGEPEADLDLVADELGLTPGRTRVVTRVLGVYDDGIREVVSRPGGGRR